MVYQIQMSKKSAFDALPRFITCYFGCELDVVRKYAHGNVLDVGAGIGRALSYLDPDKVDSYHAVEPNTHFASEIAADGIPCTVTPRTFEEAAAGFGDRQFDTALVLWNTLSMWEDPADLLVPLSRVAKSVLFTVVAKGNLPARLAYYRAARIPHRMADASTENIVSEQWQTNRAYSWRDLDTIISPHLAVVEQGCLTSYSHFAIAEAK